MSQAPDLNIGGGTHCSGLLFLPLQIDSIAYETDELESGLNDLDSSAIQTIAFGRVCPLWIYQAVYTV